MPTADPSTTSTLAAVRSEPLGRRLLGALNAAARHPLVVPVLLRLLEHLVL